MILFNDFAAEPEAQRAEQLQAVRTVMESGRYVLGDQVARFERRWAEACGVGHAVGVGNGMDAIEIGLRACGIGAGDEVITTPMTAFATVLAIMRAGAAPVFADIDPETGLLDLESAQRCLSVATKAVLLVHLYGRSADLDRWQAFTNRHAIALVEDCAQAHLARWNGRSVGSAGRFGAFSFYPTKNLCALGDAGAIVTNDAQLMAAARRLRNYGQVDRYHHAEAGVNSRLDELQAAILNVRLAWTEGFTARRRAVAARYQDELRNPKIRTLRAPDTSQAHVHHLYVVFAKEPSRLAEHLLQHGVQSLSHYPVPAHMQPPARDARRDAHGLRVSEEHAASCLSIPCHPQLSDDDVTRTIGALNAY